MRDGTDFEYDSATARTSIVGEFSEIVRYRDFLRVLISKTIKSRYKRSALGVAWTLLNPLVQMIVLSVVFSSLFRTAAPRYPVYLLIGLTAWNFFSQSTAFAMGQLFWGGSLMQRAYLPPTVFAVASVANGLVNVGLSLVPLVAIMLVLGQPFYATWWFFPVAIAVLAVFSLGVALLMSSLAVFFVDVRDMYELLLQALFYLTPILYPKELLASHAWVINLNPIYYMIEIVRKPIYEGQLPDLRTFGLSVVIASATLMLGAWVFTRKADEFGYRL
jgi:ABC-2 type transport system permease protein